MIGNNAEVARFSGIDVAPGQARRCSRCRALVAGIAGVLFAARLGSVRANIGEGFELDIITMVLLGGVSIFGGSGNLVGVALAICIVLNLRNGLGLANVEANIQTGVIGGAADRLGAGPEPPRPAALRARGDRGTDPTDRTGAQEDPESKERVMTARSCWAALAVAGARRRGVRG